ncbi:hypothetical protein EV129_115117 [Rhizobium azibense]|uniref:Uncharacterized protein n=1 Tax=Rhizobium azibense TaxID=1136135 RepID=A0A4R3RJ66_9HYPH|nr:hypothetical protein EV129_115117 [Rhizobium azibense]
MTLFRQKRLSFRKRIPRENRPLISVDGHLDDLVDQLRLYQFLKNEIKQLPLQRRQDLRDDDHKARMQFFLRIEFSKVAGVVRDEGEISLDYSRHEIPIGFAAQSQPIDVETIVAVTLGHGHERRMKAFIDEKLHEVAPDGFRAPSFESFKRFTDFTFSP